MRYSFTGDFSELMLNKKIAILAADLLLIVLVLSVSLPSMLPTMAIAQDSGWGGAVSGTGNANEKASVPKTSSTDSWQWLQNDPNAKSVESVPKDAAPAPEVQTKPASSAVTSMPQPAEKSPEKKVEQAPVLHFERQVEAAAKASKPKSTMLYGRIEQLTSTAGAQFPIRLKAQTARMDLRGNALQGAAGETLYSGTIVRSFPTSFEGVWGGKLQVYQMQLDPLYYQLDPAEARQTADLLRTGEEGSVNLQFDQRGSVISLEPAQIFFQVPMSESRYHGLMDSMSSGGAVNIPGVGALPAGMGQMMKSMMASMPYTFSVSLGNASGTGVSGNAVQASVLRDDIHQLSANVVEQQIVTTESSTDPKTGRTRKGYAESVVRATRYDASRMYVQAASVDYSEDKRFVRKFVFVGWVVKGATQTVNPMGDLQKMLPPGFNPMNGGGGNNPFQGLFGQ